MATKDPGLSSSDWKMARFTTNFYMFLPSEQVQTHRSTGFWHVAAKNGFQTSKIIQIYPKVFLSVKQFKNESNIFQLFQTPLSSLRSWNVVPGGSSCAKTALWKEMATKGRDNSEADDWLIDWSIDQYDYRILSYNLFISLECEHCARLRVKLQVYHAAHWHPEVALSPSSVADGMRNIYIYIHKYM